MRIGLFDSGVGGLTVLKKIVEEKPNNEYIYIGDTLNVPYGNKSKEELFLLSSKIVKYFISKKVELVIIACGTVSSNISTDLKNTFEIPIIDIINPTIDYIKDSQYCNIGVIATNMTIKSKIFSKSLTKKNVIEVACPKLVPAIENNNIEEIKQNLSNYLENFINHKIDLLVLGCTHYPIVSNYIESILTYKPKLLNMAIPIIDKIDNGNNSSIEIYYTKIDNIILENTNKILKETVYDINIIEI